MFVNNKKILFHLPNAISIHLSSVAVSSIGFGVIVSTSSVHCFYGRAFDQATFVDSLVLCQHFFFFRKEEYCCLYAPRPLRLLLLLLRDCTAHQMKAISQFDGGATRLLLQSLLQKWSTSNEIKLNLPFSLSRGVSVVCKLTFTSLVHHWLCVCPTRTIVHSRASPYINRSLTLCLCVCARLRGSKIIGSILNSHPTSLYTNLIFQSYCPL